MKFNKKPNSIINTEERNSRFGTFLLLGIGMFLIFGSVLTAILVPYINTLPIYINQRATYSTSSITAYTELDSKNQLTLSTKNNESLVFSTDNEEYQFTNEEPIYIYGDKAGYESNITMVFAFSGDYQVNSVSLYTCTEDGQDITLIEAKKIYIGKKEENSTTIFYSSTQDIYIYSVIISYQLRVK